MGSTGSVAQLFARQLAAGGPLTVTHPDMRRYFIAPTEAIGSSSRGRPTGQRLAHAPRRGAGAGNGAPIRILDLAHRMIRAAGLAPGRDVAIRFTAPREGEKLAEQTCHGAEPVHRTRDPALIAVTPHAATLALAARAFDELEAACRGGDETLALNLVSRLIPGFSHRPEGRANRMRA